MGSSNTTTSTSDPYAGVKDYLDSALADISGSYSSGNFEIDPYSGDLVAAYDPMRAEADAATSGVTTDSLAKSDDLYSMLQGYMDSSDWKEGLDDVANNVIADIMPSINSSFAMDGRTGSGLHQQNLASGLASGLADAYYEAYGDAQDRALTAGGLVDDTANMSYDALDYLRAAGTDRQEYEQDIIDAAVFQDQEAQTAEMEAMQDYIDLLTSIGYGTSSSTSSSDPGLLELGGTAASSLALLYASGLLSDRRMKEDIEPVGMSNGLTVYRYRYKGDPQVRFGHMADEVEKIRPDAVFEVHGIKGVDYNVL